MPRHVLTAEDAKKGVAARRAKRSEGRKIAKIMAEYGISSEIMGSIKDIITEFLRTANSNPLMGITTAIVTAEVLFKLKIISSSGYIAILASIGLLEGAAVTPDVLDAIGNDISAIGSLLKPFGFSSTSTPPNPIEPSATTIVYASGSDSNKYADLQALLPRNSG